MTEQSDVDYGPLKNLIGAWAGDKGLDVQSPFMHNKRVRQIFVTTSQSEPTHSPIRKRRLWISTERSSSIPIAMS